MSHRRPLSALTGLQPTATALAALTVAAGVALAPTHAAAQATQLPGIVVHGGTLAPPPPASPTPASPTPPVAGSEPAAPKAAAKGTAKAATPTGAPAATATTAGAPLSTATTATTGASATDGGDRAGGVPADRLGTSVSVVTGDELRRQQIRTAAEALRGLPGVAVSRIGGASGVTTVRLRGAEGNHTLVLIDGIEANDATTGAFDFSDLSTDNIERIEVLRGPQSGLYGANALGGVINIITRGGRGPLELAVRAEGGSFRTGDAAARLSGGTDRAWGSLSYHLRSSAGFDVSPVGHEKDASRLATLALRGGVRIIDGVTLDFSLRMTDKFGERDTEGGPVGGLAVQVDDAASFTNRAFLGGANLRWDTLGGALTHMLKVSRNETRTADISSSFISNNISEAVRTSYLATYRFTTPGLMRSAHTITSLLEREQESFTPLSDFADGIERARHRVAAAFEYRGEFLDRLFLTGNVRRDDNDTFADFTTWRASASLKLPEIGLRPHASVGTAVKAPSMLELYGLLPGFFTPNPNLMPEQSFGWDAGVEFTFARGAFVLDVTWFEQDLRNRINGLAPGPGFTFTAVNEPGTSRRDGIEVGARWQIAPALLASVAYTHLVAVDASGLDEVRRPRDSGRIDLTYLIEGGRGTLTLGAAYNGVQQDQAFRILGYFGSFPFTTPERVALGDYWLLSAAASYKIQPGVELYGRVENLLDARYQELYGFATPGVAAYGGVRLTFGGEGPNLLAPPASAHR